MMPQMMSQITRAVRKVIYSIPHEAFSHLDSSEDIMKKAMAFVFWKIRQLHTRDVRSKQLSSALKLDVAAQELGPVFNQQLKMTDIVQKPLTELLASRGENVEGVKEKPVVDQITVPIFLILVGQAQEDNERLPEWSLPIGPVDSVRKLKEIHYPDPYKSVVTTPGGPIPAQILKVEVLEEVVTQFDKVREQFNFPVQELPSESYRLGREPSEDAKLPKADYRLILQRSGPIAGELSLMRKKASEEGLWHESEMVNRARMALALVCAAGRLGNPRAEMIFHPQTPKELAMSTLSHDPYHVYRNIARLITKPVDLLEYVPQGGLLLNKIEQFDKIATEKKVETICAPF